MRTTTGRNRASTRVATFAAELIDASNCRQRIIARFSAWVDFVSISCALLQACKRIKRRALLETAIVNSLRAKIEPLEIKAEWFSQALRVRGSKLTVSCNDSLFAVVFAQKSKRKARDASKANLKNAIRVAIYKMQFFTLFSFAFQ